jgi:hypothetical protein
MCALLQTCYDLRLSLAEGREVNSGENVDLLGKWECRSSLRQLAIFFLIGMWDRITQLV